MKLFDILGLQDARITLKDSKVHLATHNGTDNPLRVYFEGKFDEWQSWQNKRNFGKPFVVSLIQLPERDRWLYVGTYAVKASEWREADKVFWYTLEPVQACAELGGRLVVDFERPGRASYLLGESFGAQMVIHELRPERMHLEEFPGFKKVDLEWPDLEILVRQNATSWRTALSNVAGVYLISDPADGKLYVGSATGEGGIWARWSQYVDGHGKNIELLKLIGAQGKARARAFRFSILEIADVHASRDEIVERESHWKRVLLTRSHGYNAN
jgi:GIY-YIG catalytic domain